MDLGEDKDLGWTDTVGITAWVGTRALRNDSSGEIQSSLRIWSFHKAADVDGLVSEYEERLVAYPPRVDVLQDEKKKCVIMLPI